MALQTWADLGTAVSGGMAVLTAFVAAGALYYAHRQLRSAGSIARETTALSAYREYLRLCVDFPQFSSSKLALSQLGRSDWRGVVENLTVESERYLWVLSVLLNTCELVLTAEPAEMHWRRTLLDQLNYHNDSLREVWSKWMPHYGPEMRLLVAEVLDS